MNPPDPQIVALEQRIATLEAELAALRHPNAAGAAEANDQHYLFEALVANAVDVVFVANFDGTLRYVNPAFERLLGYGNNSLKQPTWSYIVEGKDSAHLKAAIDHVMQHGSWIGRLNYRCADGRNDPTWTVEFISSGTTSLYGCAPEDFLAVDGTPRHAFVSFTLEEERDWIWETVQAALNEHRPFQLSYRIRDLSGRLKWGFEQGNGIYDAEGNLIFIDGFVTDISAQHQAEEERNALQSQVIAAQSAGRCGNSALRPSALINHSAGGLWKPRR
ncbi:MAG: PAS domain-containing protein [Oscillochloridaceae bacterium umkhey_bin13]